jgi:hypothetical protein
MVSVVNVPSSVKPELPAEIDDINDKIREANDAIASAGDAIDEANAAIAEANWAIAEWNESHPDQQLGEIDTLDDLGVRRIAEITPDGSSDEDGDEHPS